MRFAWRLRQLVWTAAWALSTLFHRRPKKVPVPRREGSIALEDEMKSGPDRYGQLLPSRLKASVSA